MTLAVAQSVVAHAARMLRFDADDTTRVARRPCKSARGRSEPGPQLKNCVVGTDESIHHQPFVPLDGPPGSVVRGAVHWAWQCTVDPMALLLNKRWQRWVANGRKESDVVGCSVRPFAKRGSGAVLQLFGAEACQHPIALHILST